MKKIIFFALALMALVGAGIGGYILFGSKAQEAHAKEEEEEAPKPTGPPAYQQLPPIVLPLMGPKRVEQTVIIVVSLEVDGEASKDTIRPYLPRLNEAYLRALYGNLKQADVIEGQLLDIGKIKDRLVKATDEVMEPVGHKGLILDVLIQNVTQRPAF